MTNDEKLLLIQAALDDWERGKLSEISTLVAISIAIRPQPKLTDNDIEYGQRLLDNVDLIERVTAQV